MEFRILAETLSQIEKESARLKITQLLAALWRQIEPTSAWQVANLIEGQLKPPYESLEFYLSEKMIARSLIIIIQQNGGLSGDGLAFDMFGQADEDSIATQVKKIHQQLGDWGETCAHIHRDLWPEKNSLLTIDEVYQKLLALALASGEGSQEIKLNLLSQLLSQVDSISAKIISRIVIGKLRLGFSTMTILDSLSWAAVGDKSESKQLEEIYQKKADIGLLAQSYLQLLSSSSVDRWQSLAATYQIEVGVPVVLALCQRLNSSHEIIEKMNEVIAEPKYDGMRIQIHLKKTPAGVKVAAFTRNLENVTAMLPELNTLAEILPVESAILDSEAIGYNQITGQFLPFQEMMTRRRKHQVAEKSKQLPIKFYIFDLLYLNQKECLLLPLSQRKKLLQAIISAAPCLELTPFIVTSDPVLLHQYHRDQLKMGLEGMIAKMSDGVYQSGRKGWSWVKIKEEEGTRGKLNDTLDLVVMGTYAGKGKRHAFGVGAFLVGLKNHQGEFLTISKVGTGLTDEVFKELAERIKTLQTTTKPANYKVNKNIAPDKWLSPHLVAEIAADEITKSNLHTSGFGLRFPRLIKWRDDKNPEQATDMTELKNIKVAT